MYKSLIYFIFLININYAFAQIDGISINISILTKMAKPNDLDSIKLDMFKRIEMVYAEDALEFNIIPTMLYANDTQRHKIFIEIKDTIQKNFSSCFFSKILFCEKDPQHSRFGIESFSNSTHTLENTINSLIFQTKTLLITKGNICTSINTVTKNISDLSNQDEIINIENLFIYINKNKNVNEEIFNKFKSIIINTSNISQTLFWHNFNKSNKKKYYNIFFQESINKANKNYSIIYNIDKAHNNYILKIEFNGKNKSENYYEKIKISEKEFVEYIVYYTKQIIDTYSVMRKLNKLED